MKNRDSTSQALAATWLSDDCEEPADLDAETFAAAASARVLMKLTKIRMSNCPSILFFISLRAAQGVMPGQFLRGAVKAPKTSMMLQILAYREILSPFNSNG